MAGSGLCRARQRRRPHGDGIGSRNRAPIGSDAGGFWRAGARYGGRRGARSTATRRQHALAVRGGRNRSRVDRAVRVDDARGRRADAGARRSDGAGRSAEPGRRPGIRPRSAAARYRRSVRAASRRRRHEAARRRYLFAVAPMDAGTLSIAIAVFTATASIAAAVPAMRAARIDPIGALRSDH